MLAIVKIRFADNIDVGFLLNQTRCKMATVAFELEFELFLVRKFASDAKNKNKVLKRIFPRVRNYLKMELPSSSAPICAADLTGCSVCALADPSSRDRKKSLFLIAAKAWKLKAA